MPLRPQLFAQLPHELMHPSEVLPNYDELHVPFCVSGHLVTQAGNATCAVEGHGWQSRREVSVHLQALLEN